MAQIGLFTLVKLDKHAQDGRQTITGVGEHTDDAQTADFLRPLASVALAGSRGTLINPLRSIAQNIDRRAQ